MNNYSIMILMKKFIKKHYKKFLYSIIIICVLYIIFGFALFLQLASVPSGYAFPENTPSSFTLKEIFPDTEPLNTSQYAMDNFDTVSFPSLDADITISAWYIPSKKTSSVGIIVVPGYRQSKAQYRQLMIASLLHEYYHVLIIDLRNTGMSTVTNGRTTMGNTEYKDVLGAKQWFNAKGITQIGLVGISMGASTAAITFSYDTSIKATMLDTPFTSIKDIMQEELARLNIPKFLWFSGYIVGYIFFNTNLLEHDIRNMLAQNTGNRWLMFYHALDDPRVNIQHSKKTYQLLQQKNVPHVYTWFYNSQEHSTQMVHDPQEYQKRMIDFFNKAFTTSK